MNHYAMFREYVKDVKRGNPELVLLTCPEGCVRLEIEEVMYVTPRAGVKFECYTRRLGNTEDLVRKELTTLNNGGFKFSPALVVPDDGEFAIKVMRHGKGPTDVDVMILYSAVPRNGLERAIKRVGR